MNLKSSEQYNLLVRAALIDASNAAPTMDPISVLQVAGYAKVNKETNKWVIDRRRLFADLAKDGGRQLRRHTPGVGRAAYFGLIKYLLETN